MVKKAKESGRCGTGSGKASHFSAPINSAVHGLLVSCRSDDYCFDSINSVFFPSRDEVIRIIHNARDIIFPGYSSQDRVDSGNLEHYLAGKTSDLFESLSTQIALTIKHDCLGFDLPCSDCMEEGHKKALHFIQELPALRNVLAKDVRASLEGDPAAKSYNEVILSYPGLFSITVYRLAHVLTEIGVPLLPRMMTEYAHSLTGIDIHPGAKIGESFFIDHGTGVVIGETTEIGHRVRLYQGVTLGALSIPTDDVSKYRNMKRHPTIEDDVIIYANATLLGENAIIGARSIIGGNVWLTDRVPPDTKVLLKPPKLIFIGNHL